MALDINVRKFTVFNYSFTTNNALYLLMTPLFRNPIIGLYHSYRKSATVLVTMSIITQLKYLNLKFPHFFSLSSSWIPNNWPNLENSQEQKKIISYTSLFRRFLWNPNINITMQWVSRCHPIGWTKTIIVNLSFLVSVLYGKPWGKGVPVKNKTWKIEDVCVFHQHFKKQNFDFYLQWYLSFIVTRKTSG